MDAGVFFHSQWQTLSLILCWEKIDIFLTLETKNKATLHVNVFALKSMVHYRSAFEPCASGLPYYCTPPVCVPAIIGALAVWRKKNSS